MLIKALCDYYDILAQNGQVAPEGYSRQEISYLVALNDDGSLADIIDWRQTEIVPVGKTGKTKEKKSPRSIMMPLPATNKSSICANPVDCRSNYIFGLTNSDKPKDMTKALDAHKAFVKVNLEFLDHIPDKSPVVTAFYKFLCTWQTEREKNNELLIKIGKELDTGKFAFCLAGRPDILLHDDKSLLNAILDKQDEKADDNDVGICAITGERAPIARLHNKIKKIIGGQSTGTSLVSFNNASEESYTREQSFNSSISEFAMKKYTEALNMLTGDQRHRVMLGDLTIVFWGMNTSGQEIDIMSQLLSSGNGMDAEDTNKMLFDLFKDAKNGAVARQRIANLNSIQDDTEFYIMGIKPNSARLAIKFVDRKKFGLVLQNIAQFQIDMALPGQKRCITLWQIFSELLPPQTKDKNPDPSLLSSTFEAMINNWPLPYQLLSKTIFRIKTDIHGNDATMGDKALNQVRIGIIKAYLNRMWRARNVKEEIPLALNKEENNQAYLCGRLFAVLERNQQLATDGRLNRTIRDAYFTSAASMPSSIFPRILQLSGHYLKKLETNDKVGLAKYQEKLTGEIMDALAGEFPKHLALPEQGRFIIGYYQQKQDFFKKNSDKNTEEE